MARKSFTSEELLYLTQSDEFQQIFASDPELDQLEAQRYDEKLEFHLTMEALGQVFCAGTQPIRSITPAIWSLLWTLGNRYTRDEKPTETDADLFLWVLSQTPLKSFQLSELPGEASGFFKKAGLSFQDADLVIREMIDAAFAPLSLLPPKPDDEIRFDSDWLVRISGIAARESNETFSHCMMEMPLSVCFWHLINDQRRSDYKHTIRRRPEKELCAAMLERTDDLCEQFLIKKGLRKAGKT